MKLLLLRFFQWLDFYARAQKFIFLAKHTNSFWRAYKFYSWQNFTYCPFNVFTCTVVEPMAGEPPAGAAPGRTAAGASGRCNRRRAPRSRWKAALCSLPNTPTRIQGIRENCVFSQSSASVPFLTLISYNKICVQSPISWPPLTA